MQTRSSVAKHEQDADGPKDNPELKQGSPKKQNKAWTGDIWKEATP